MRRLRGNDVDPIAPGEAFAVTLDRLARVPREAQVRSARSRPGNTRVEPVTALRTE